MTEVEVIEALDHHDFGLDGKWSSQTKLLVAQLGAQKLELNKWWAFTPQNWKCPSCNKPKRELVRLSGSKCLVAKLVSHHDHTNELVESHAPVVWLPDGSREPTAYALREHLKGLAKGFLTRFPPTIVCEQCNNLELVLKKKLGIPETVTLSPSEIGKLRNYDSKTHDQILDDLISQLLEWADLSAKHIELAKLHFRPEIHPIHVGNAGWHNAADQVKRSAVSIIENKCHALAVQGIDNVDQFLNLSLANPSSLNSNRPKLPSPTEIDYLSFKHPDPLRQSVINEIALDWSCPICWRSAFQCFASSRKTPRKFMLNLLKRTISIEFGQVEETTIVCKDCSDFHNGLVRYCQDKGLDELQYLAEPRKIEVEAVRQGIKTAPHQRHLTDYDAAIDFLLGPFSQDADLDIEPDF